MSPRPPSKNGASAWYLFVSTVFDAKSSEKTTVLIWAQARGRPADRKSTDVRASRFREAARGCKRAGVNDSVRRVLQGKNFGSGKLEFLIGSPVCYQRKPIPSAKSAQDIRIVDAAKRFGAEKR